MTAGDVEEWILDAAAVDLEWLFRGRDCSMFQLPDGRDVWPNARTPIQELAFFRYPLTHVGLVVLCWGLAVDCNRPRFRFEG